MVDPELFSAGIQLICVTLRFVSVKYTSLPTLWIRSTYVLHKIPAFDPSQLQQRNMRIAINPIHRG